MSPQERSIAVSLHRWGSGRYTVSHNRQLRNVRRRIKRALRRARKRDGRRIIAEQI